MSDLRAWIESVGSESERAIAAVHDDQHGTGRCPTCATLSTFDGDPFELGTLRPAPWPCPTVRLIADAHRTQPGFRPGWASKNVEITS